MKKLILILVALSLVSCSSNPFASKKDTASTTTSPDSKPTQAQQAARVGEDKPSPGDIKVIDGVEYIYARNRRFMFTPYEPEYTWIRKDQYVAGPGENILTKGPSTKEQQELEKRLAKIEEDMKKKGLPPQMAYPSQMAYLPPGMGYMSPLPMVTFNYPSPKIKRRVIVLPITDQTNYKDEQLGELATKRLISRLENSGIIICVDPNSVNLKGNLTGGQSLKTLNETFGIQAVLKGSLADVFTSTSKIEGKDDRETSFAVSKILVDIYNTDTGVLMKQLSGRNPVFLSREKGDLSSEKAKIRAVDLSIEIIAEDLLKAILSLDWHARIASIDKEKVYINAGRLSGLEKGGIIEVYSPGEEVIDPTTKMPLGRTKGSYKGELEVVELFGVDASWARIKKGSNFSATDLVYLKAQEGAVGQGIPATVPAPSPAPAPKPQDTKKK
jgi:hypothetical protein